MVDESSHPAVFSASTFAASTPGQIDSGALLRQLRRSQSTRSLEAALARVEELVNCEADDDELPAELIPVLQRVTSAVGAPLTFRSLHDRVAAGHTTWAAWWRDPAAEADGLRLLGIVTRERLTEATRALQSIEED